jgi:molybdopterin-containing oxidoreductase family membrane subunit
MRHIECMAKVMLGTGLIVAYGYAMEAFMAWYSGDEYERYAFLNRMWVGGYWWTYWLLILCNILIPQLLWSKRVRLHVLSVFLVSLVVNVGMWLERFVIVVTSLTRDFVPSSWGMYYPTVWDWSTYFGTIGVFLSLMFLFVRGLPAISIFEMREVVHHTNAELSHAHGD